MHHGFGIENTDIAAEILVTRLAACDFVDNAVQTKPFAKRFYQAFGEVVVQIPQQSVEVDAVYKYIERVVFLRDVHKL